MSDDDPIRRASALPAPTSTDVLLLHTLRLAVNGRVKRLDRWLAMVRDAAAAANIIRLHEKDGDADWRRAFVEAPIRAEAVAALLRAEISSVKSRRSKRPR